MENLKALILDDSRAMQSILSRILTELGISSVTAANGKAGLTCLKEHPEIALALVDWNMPEMNGLEFVTAVRADSKNNGIKLLMVTTETEMNQVVKAIEAGVDEYVMKPFTKDALLEKIKLLGLQ